MTRQSHNDSQIRLRQTASMAVVFVITAMVIGILTNLIYLMRILPYIDRGQPTFYVLSAVVSLIETVLLCTAVLLVFKSLGRTREQLLRDTPSGVTLADTGSGGCTKLKFAAGVATVLVLMSLLAGIGKDLLQLKYIMEQSRGNVDVFSLLMMILDAVAGFLLDGSLLMVLVSLLRIKVPVVGSEPNI